MSSRLLARASLAACLFLVGVSAHATVTYNGTEGVAANFFEAHGCTGCHFSPGSATYANVVLDNYSSAFTYATMAKRAADWDDGFYDGTSAGNWRMPYGASSQVPEADLTFLQSWIDGGRPQNAVPSVSGFSTGAAAKYTRVLNISSINDNGADASYTVEWRTSAGSYTVGNSAVYYTNSSGTSTSSSGSTDWTGGGTSTKSISHTATGLSCGTNYVFRVRGTNSVGTTTTGETAFTTSACPSVSSITGTTTLNEDQSFSLTVNTSGGVTSYSLSGAPSGMSISAGVISWSAASTPDSPTTSTGYNFTVVVGDGTTTSNYNTSVTVTPVNDAPTINNTAPTTATEDVQYVHTVSASDTEGNALTYSFTSAVPGDMAFGTGLNANRITWTPTNGVTTSGPVTFQVSDGNGGTDTETVTIAVTPTNDAPTINNTAPTTATEDVQYVHTVSASDIDGNPLTYSFTSAVPGNMAFGIGLNANRITWTPTNGVTTSGPVTFQVSDGNGGTDTETVTIAVTPVNDAPTIDNTAPTSATEDMQYTHTVSASDIDGDSLTYSFTSAVPGNMAFGTGLNANRITWTPTNGVTTSGPVTFQVSDGNGGTDTETFTITVSQTNDAPVINSTAPDTATEDVQYVYDVVASDIDGNPLVYSFTSAVPGNMAFGTGLNANRITWTPTNGVTTSGSITIQVSDGSATDTQTFTVAVTPTNDAPTIDNTAPSTATEDVQYVHTVSASDIDGDSLTYSFTSAVPGNMAFGSGATANRITWTPTNGVTTSGPVTFQVSDGNGGTDTETVTIAVTPTNDAPTIDNTAPSTATEDVQYVHTVSASDIDGDSLTYSFTSAVPGNMAFGSGATANRITWTPTNGVTTSGPVTFQVSDGNGGTDTETVTIAVTAVNDAPVIGGVSDGSMTELDTPVVINVGVTDVDDSNNGSNLSWSVSSAPAVTWITISSTGVLTLAPPENSEGDYTVTVQVADGGENGALPSSTSFLLHISKLDSDGDEVADYDDNCPAIANPIIPPALTQANNDGDSEGDLCDSDDDEDGIPDTVEVANGLDPFDGSDAGGDLNNNGTSNLDEYLLACGSDPQCYNISNPVIVTNGDQEVDASGYFTAVELAAEATGVSGPLVVTADDSGPFRPGVHIVTWSAPWRAADNSLHVATKTQQVKVRPLLTMGGSAVVRADDDRVFRIPVRLNGTAPSYPVTATFSVTGGVETQDYFIVDGDVTFESGIDETEEAITLRLPDLGPAVDKTLTITVTGLTGEAALSAASQRTYTVTVTTQPVAPTIRALSAHQGGPIRQVIYQGGDSVTVSAEVVDQFGTTIGCSGLSTSLTTVSSNNAICEFVLDPSSVPAGVYDITVSATNAGLTASRRLSLSLIPGSGPLLDGSEDSDGDDVNDDIEGAVDENRNGLLDYLDVMVDADSNGSESPESIQISLNASELLLMAVTDSGLKMVAGPYAVAAQSPQQAGIQIFETQVATGVTPIIDADYAAIGAIYDFRITGLTSANRTAHVVLPLPIVLLPGVQWRELSGSGQWMGFVSQVSAAAAGASADGISSASRKDDGQCPAPQDADYEPGLTPGAECIQLTLTDGGPNDADGEANGSIQMTGAPTVLREEVEGSIPDDSQSGGSADFYILLLLALATLVFRRKEQMR